MTRYVLPLVVCLASLTYTFQVAADPTAEPTSTKSKEMLVSAPSVNASEMNCVAPDNSVTVSLLRDGGEETLEVKSQNKVAESFLILQRDSRQIVAIKDGDVYGGDSKRGVALIFNAYGSSYLAFGGELILVKCQQ